MHNGTKIYCIDVPAPYLAPYTLTQMLNRLPDVCKVHRSFAVCIPRMQSTNKNKTRVYFHGKPEVIVSDAHRPEFLKRAGFEEIEPESIAGSAANLALSASK
ncbi:MAG: LytTR family transcriptional regulator [Chitinophagaceae bacterium]|nr:LytTR family transcriptional regulator [Chitinophagaceae bacterium]